MNVSLKSDKGKLNIYDVASIIGEQYILNRSLGQGSFGEIFECYDKLANMKVAVKVERKTIPYPQLEYESKVYRYLHQPPINLSDILSPQMELSELGCELNLGYGWSTKPQERPFVAVGIPTVYTYRSEKEHNFMVMELCGPSLEDLFNYCHRRFSLKTVLMLADQMLHRIEYIHNRGLMHRDIKTENFVFGMGKKSHILHLIDFGLSKRYWNDRRQMHIPPVEGKSLTGTARYCSVNAHRGYEQSRRDDLESIGYVLVYLLKGSLPWQGMQDQDHHLRSVKIGERKITTTSEELCKGLPKEFLEYCCYCRNLSFQERPSYNYLRDLFWNLAQRMGYVYTDKNLAVGKKGKMLSMSKDINCGSISSILSASHLKDTKTRSPSEPTIHATSLTASTNRVVSPVQSTGHVSGRKRIVNFESPPSASIGSKANGILNSKMVNVSTFKCSPCDDFLNSKVKKRKGERLNSNNYKEREAYYDWMFDWFDKRQRELRRGKTVPLPTPEKN